MVAGRATMSHDAPLGRAEVHTATAGWSQPQPADGAVVLDAAPLVLEEAGSRMAAHAVHAVREVQPSAVAPLPAREIFPPEILGTA